MRRSTYTKKTLQRVVYYNVKISASLTYSAFPPFLVIKAFLSLSKYNLVMTTFDGWMLRGTEAPLDFSFCTLSIWMANFNL